METKPGTQTTEFKATVASVILAGIQSGTGVANVPDKTTFLAAAAVVISYIISRGLAKLNVTPTA